MNFTDRFISSTYGNVMVNDPFLDDKPSVVKSPTHDPIEIYNSLTAYDRYTAICDGQGNTSNLFLSISGSPWGSIWPHSKYKIDTKYFILSGNGLDQNRALIYRKDGNNYSFANSNLQITNSYAQFGNTIWPYEAASTNDILMISKTGDTKSISFDSDRYSTLQHKKESFQSININQQKSFSSGTAEITMNYGNYADPTTTKYAIFNVISYCPVSHSGSGVDTLVKYPLFNNYFKISSQFGDPLAKEYIASMIIPYNEKATTVSFKMYKEYGHGKSYSTVHYRTYYDSALLSVTLVGLINLQHN